MRHSFRMSDWFRTCWLTAAIAVLATPAGVMAQSVIPVARFRSVTVRGCGEVILRHGSTQRVTMLEGTTAHTALSVVDGDRLEIDGCQGRCPKGYQAVIEIVAPEFVDIMVRDGGMVLSQGSFPRQAEIGAIVSDGGTIDLRSMTVDHVDAAVRQGGRIFAKPQETLVADIAQGGAITYWDHPRVTTSIEHGGVVARGAAADVDKPLHELGPARDVVPPLPAVPPIPGTRRSRSS
jgi:hypothetical protein